MINNLTITNLHLDILKEIGNIGAGNAATALSTLLRKKIISQMEWFHSMRWNWQAELKILLACFKGGSTRKHVFVLPLEEASRFIQILTNDETFEFSNPPYSEIGLSAMHELGNILSGSYLSALSDFTKLHIYPSVPSLSIDMIGALLSYGLIEISTYSDRVIVIDTALEEVDGETNTRIQGHFFLLPDPNSFETIFSSLGVSS
ncbi:chemotaxis protein CheC [Bacillus coahuilensis]|uniref:chemotaxis protein CheC n=1 Tax=Bacillus coahuilensis TaxID=408580 RepID=UPI000A90DA97